MAFLSEVGCLHGDVIVEPGQETAIKYIVEEVGKRRASGGGGKWISEHSLVGSNASNGVVKRAHQPVQAKRE